MASVASLAMSSSLLQPSSPDADETIPDLGGLSISEMIAETLAMLNEDEAAWPNVLAPERVARDMGFTKTF